MLGGMAACLIWSRYGTPYFLGLDPAEAGVLVSAVLMWVVSLATRPPAYKAREFMGYLSSELPRGNFL